MSSVYAADAQPILATLANRWWALVVRGLAAIAFGILALAVPAAGLLALVVVWGAYALVDGVFNVVLAHRAGRAGWSWGWLLFEGLMSILAGVVTFAWPGITLVVLLALIAVWGVITGVAEIAAAIALRREIEHEWLLAASGVLSIAFGVLLMAYPAAGAVAIVWLVGVYAIVFGGLLCGLGMRLRRWARTHEGVMPTGGVPTLA